MNSKLVLSILCGLTLVGVVAAVVLGRRVQTAHHNQSDARRFEVHGIVRDVDPAGKTVRIAHDEIPNYMPAMTMSLPVKDATLLQKLEIGDRVQFELAVTSDDSWIARIEKIASETEMANASVNAGVSPAELDAQRVKPGEPVPDFALLNQDGKIIHLSDFHGKAVLLTFIYTRCPLPNFCPLMTKNFAELQQRLSKEFPGKCQLLSVSMDPDFDRPEVLKEYASR